MANNTILGLLIHGCMSCEQPASQPTLPFAIQFAKLSQASTFYIASIFSKCLHLTRGVILADLICFILSVCCCCRSAFGFIFACLDLALTNGRLWIVINSLTNWRSWCPSVRLIFFCVSKFTLYICPASCCNQAGSCMFQEIQLASISVCSRPKTFDARGGLLYG